MRRDRSKQTPEQVVASVFTAIEVMRKHGITMIDRRRRGQAFGSSVVEALRSAGWHILRWEEYVELHDDHQRFLDECAHCSVCGHYQAEPNWCHECGQRTTLPEWAKPYVDAWQRVQAMDTEVADVG